MGVEGIEMSWEELKELGRRVGGVGRVRGAGGTRGAGGVVGVGGVNCHRNPTLSLKIIMFLSLRIPELRKPIDAQKLIGIEKDISNPTLIISNITAKICEFIEEVNK